MISQRLVIGLQIYKGKLIKTKSFDKVNYSYLGDILNAVRIFNEKKAEELIIYDLSAADTKEINYELLEKISRVSRMPLCYGGGINTIEKAKKLFSLGFEKISFNTLIYDNIDLIKKISKIIGRQSIVFSIDYKKVFNEYVCFKNSGTYNTGIKVLDLINLNYQDFIGEIVLNDIDNDGSMNGYNKNIIEKIYNNFQIPITISGGFKDLEDIRKVFRNYKIIGICCSSLFVFKGINKAVLLNYPDREQIKKLKSN